MPVQQWGELGPSEMMRLQDPKGPVFLEDPSVVRGDPQGLSVLVSGVDGGGCHGNGFITTGMDLSPKNKLSLPLFLSSSLTSGNCEMGQQAGQPLVFCYSRRKLRH